MKNIYAGEVVKCGSESEEVLVSGKNFRICKIVSNRAASQKDFWYEQAEDEWVCLLRGNAVLEYADGSSARLLCGDWLVIGRGVKHRVASTSEDCLWLTAFGQIDT